MKRLVKVAVAGAVLAAGMACTSVQAAVTNITYNLSVALTGFQQGQNASRNDVTVPVRFGNKDILTALEGLPNASAPTGTNHFVDAHHNAVNGAKLILVFSQGGDLPVVKVRQVFNRTNIVDTDVTAWLALSQKSDSVGGSAFSYRILGLTLNNGTGTDFNVQGFFGAGKGALVGTGKARGIKLSKQTTSANGSVAGDGDVPETGDATGTYAVLHGTVGATGATIEVH